MTVGVLAAERPQSIGHPLASGQLDYLIDAAAGESICLVIREPVDYLLAADLQQHLVDAVHQNKLNSVTLLLQHNHVVTLGRGADPQDARGALLPPVRSHRGGSVTVHGPGQLVGYPILNLRRTRLTVHDYVRILEKVMASVCARFGVETETRPRYTGLWTGRGKIGSIGIAVRRGITWHGFALYVYEQQRYFGALNPCALANVVPDALEHYGQVDFTQIEEAALASIRDLLPGIAGRTIALSGITAGPAGIEFHS